MEFRKGGDKYVSNQLTSNIVFRNMKFITHQFPILPAIDSTLQVPDPVHLQIRSNYIPQPLELREPTQGLVAVVVAAAAKGKHMYVVEHLHF